MARSHARARRDDPQELPPDPPARAALAAEQGVRPIQDIDELGGDFWPEDESMDEFLATLREWREERRAANPS